MAALRQRHALAALFTTLTVIFGTIAALSAWGAGGSARRWLVAAAAAAIAGWFGSLAWHLTRRP